MNAFFRTGLWGFALIALWIGAGRDGLAQSPPCMGDRPALFSIPAPMSAPPGQTVALTGIGLSKYVDPLVYFQDPTSQTQPTLVNPAAVLATATIQNDKAASFVVPQLARPGGYELYMFDRSTLNSPAVCMRWNNGVFQGTYTVPTDADCPPQTLLCSAAPDHLKSLTYAKFEVLPGPPQPRQASVSVTTTAPLGNPICQSSPSVTEVGAFLDDVSHPTVGIVDGFSTALSMITFPADVLVNVLSRDGYDVVLGNAYPSDNGGKANLVIIAKFFSCPHNAAQFVAAHLEVFSSGPIFRVRPVKMLAGDLFNEIPLSEGVQKGVVMSGSKFDGTLSATKYGQQLAEGQVSGLVNQGAGPNLSGARIEMRFSVPLELR
jgi:hypothetical protein